MTRFLTTLMIVLLAMPMAADTRMARLFQQGMVLQRGRDIPVWGWAAQGTTVDVSIADARGRTVAEATATADSDGRWEAILPHRRLKAGGPYTLRAGNQTIGDVLVGDVWMCSGQSNIDVTVERVYPIYTQAIDNYSNDQVRLLRVPNEADPHGERTDLGGQMAWLPLTRENAWQFSAVGYFLGRRMHEATGVPQGVIVNSWGGTPIQAWVAQDSIERHFPQEATRTRLYADDALVASQREANQRANDKWHALLNERDPGLREAYASPDTDDSAWTTVDQHSWQWSGVGTCWLRQHLNIDAAHAGQPARLLLGTLVDADITYVNGQQVGRTYYQYPPRRYDIPAGLLREGDNVITVRFINKQGTAHFVNPKPYLLAFGPDRESQDPMPADQLPLNSQWLHHDGTLMPSCPSGDTSLQNMASTLYNALIAPMRHFPLAGVVWYQGESNTGSDACHYGQLLRMLTQGWRDAMGQPSLPFVIVQLASFMEPSDYTPQDSGWSHVREAQRTVADSDPLMESVVTIDLGEAADIHPLRKREVADRVGLCLERLALGRKVTLFPRVISVTTGSDGSVRLTCDQQMREGNLKYFEIATADGPFMAAEATAIGNTITISLPQGMAGRQPARLRYAWKNNPGAPDAYSTAGLPLSPFQTIINNKSVNP